MSPSSSFGNAWQRGPGEVSSAVSDPGLAVWKGCPLGCEESWADQTQGAGVLEKLLRVLAAGHGLQSQSQGPTERCQFS